jgi:diguanylate cyclase (GGDEF)-like protein
VQQIQTLPELPPNFTVEELEQQELLRSVDLTIVEPLLRNASVRTLSPGDVLIEAGAMNRHLYLLLSGQLSVRLASLQSEPVLTLEVGQSVGELSLVDHKPASAFVVAESESRVLVVDEELVWIITNSSHGVASNLLFMLVKRLRYGNDIIFQDRERLERYKFNATTDPLTGLFNRRWLTSMLPRQVQRSHTCAEPLSLVMIDIDHFKQFNDEHGHVAGDHALCAAASSIRDSVRPADMVVRYGGEEFLVILPDCTSDSACILSERLGRAVFSARTAEADGPTLPAITISLGVAQLEPGQSMEPFVEAVDMALYRAKRAGRDTVSR